MDNLMEQIVNISKAGAFDIVSKQVGELKEQNIILKNAIGGVLNEITKMDVKEVSQNPSLLVARITAICSKTLNLRPL